MSYCADCARDPQAAMQRAWRAATEDGLAGESVAMPPDPVDDDPIGRIARFTHPRKLPTAIATGALAVGMLLWTALAPGGAKRPLLRRLESHAEAATLQPAPVLAAALSHALQLPGARATLFVHPLPGAQLLVPVEPIRRFGADREGLGRARGCGHGHCGVDIGERVGAPVVAVADGVVRNVVRYDNFNGGLYVRVDHDDNTSSFYFHLHAIRRDLRPGVTVHAGEAIAELGRSGILNSPAHLHFAIAIRQGEHDHYVDPEPYLHDAVLLGAPTSGDLSAMVGNEGPSIARLAERRAVQGAAPASEGPAAPVSVETPGISD